ncbi:polynucleotide adenylyltransferase PcnB [Endozoicomonas acroporae]|uniref:polynucleotide adenylyltransferase PcnB n=1 Tax=Endozoicomonas acroporae TaxID=1701104 RepID=UPI000C75F918|nr:polynucleotide adenylyltransferase PcnB [Endozoicomonas acroporae]
MYSFTTAMAVLVLGGTLIFWLMRNRNRSKRHRPTFEVTGDPQKTVIPRDKHPVSRRYINDNALKVINRLTSQGYEAYLVGGCIRDLYLDLHPKDFDVATNASPEDVRRLFRNSRLIGRRFKLVHVLFGREMIEVATFRANHEQHHGQEKSRHSESGRILRDNVYGTIEDDAMRRDFTVNALYYDGRDFSVVDFCNGVDDIRTGTLRLIGDPVTRYHEDPVRMLRAIRFAAKLNFTMAPETEQPIRDLGQLLHDIPAARLFDEVLKLLQSGQGVRTFELLQEYQLFGPLFPATAHCLHEQDRLAGHLIIEALKSTDKRVRQNRPVTPAFLFAALLWAPMRRMARELMDQGIPPVPAFQQASMTVITNQCHHTAIPRRFSMVVRDIWDLQIRLERRQPKLIETLLEHPKFRAAYDFLVLREQAGENLSAAGQWWTEIQELDEHGRHAMIRSLTSHGGQKKQGNKRRRRRRKPRSGDASSAHQSGES